MRLRETTNLKARWSGLRELLSDYVAHGDVRNAEKLGKATGIGPFTHTRAT